MNDSRSAMYSSCRIFTEWVVTTDGEDVAGGDLDRRPPEDPVPSPVPQAAGTPDRGPLHPRDVAPSRARTTALLGVGTCPSRLPSEDDAEARHTHSSHQAGAPPRDRDQAPAGVDRPALVSTRELSNVARPVGNQHLHGWSPHQGEAQTPTASHVRSPSRWDTCPAV